MNRADREKRDATALQLFVAGSTYAQIAAAIGLKSQATIHNIVMREMAAAARRRGLLSDEAFAVWQERTERLFRAHWGLALDTAQPGTHRSAEICRKILAQQAHMYGIDGDLTLDNNMGEVVDSETDPLKEQEPQDELARLRALRAGA